MCYNGAWPTQLAHYASADPKLLKWALADKGFASIVEDTTGRTMGAVGAIAPASCCTLPGATQGAFVMNSMEGGQWVVGTYCPQTGKMAVKRSAPHERPVVGGQSWDSETYAEYQFTATRPAGEADDGSDRPMQIGWVWKGDWKRGPSPNHGSVDLLSLIYDLRFDAAMNKLVAAPVPEYSKLHNGTLVAEPRVSLPAGNTTTLPLKNRCRQHCGESAELASPYIGRCELCDWAHATRSDYWFPGGGQRAAAAAEHQCRCSQW